MYTVFVKTRTKPQFTGEQHSGAPVTINYIYSMGNQKMDEKIFREKSIEQLSTPDDLTSYLRVTGPGVWVVLSGVIVLLAGLLCWGVFGNVISTVNAPAVVKDGKLSCYVIETDIDLSDPEIDIKIGNENITAKSEDAKTETLSASEDAAIFESGYLEPGKSTVILTGDTALSDGFYNAVVTTETLKPISLLLSKG